MEEQMIKTSLKQRILIGIIAAILLGSSVAVYISVVLAKGNTTGAVDEAKIAELEEKYEGLYSDYSVLAKNLSDANFETLSGVRSRVSSYNNETANAGGVVKTDLKIGDGEEITSESTGYGTYYIGWCADETVFDSSFDDFASPTSLKAPLVVEKDSLIEGWYAGLDGMKLGGIREITIPGTLAYGEDYDPCGNDGTNVPLKFVIMPIALSDEFKNLAAELSEVYADMMYAYYGMQE